MQKIYLPLYMSLPEYCDLCPFCNNYDAITYDGKHHKIREPRQFCQAYYYSNGQVIDGQWASWNKALDEHQLSPIEWKTENGERIAYSKRHPDCPLVQNQQNHTLNFV